MNKQNFLTRMLLLLALIVGSVNGAWAENVTILSADFESTSGWDLSGKTSSQSNKIGTGNSLQIASSKGAGSATSPAFSSLVGNTATLTFNHISSSGSAARTLTITGNGCKVDGKASTTVTVGTSVGSSTIEITEASTTSTITFSAASGQGTIIDDVVVYYTKASDSPLASIALTGTYPTTFAVGDAFSHEGMTVTATYENATTNDVTNKASFSGYDMSATGNQTVIVSYTENDVTKTATYNIAVKSAAGLVFTPTSQTVAIGGKKTISFSKATDAEVTFVVADETIATYDPATGKVSGKKEGTTTITATSAENSNYSAGEAICTITVIDPNWIDYTTKGYTNAEDVTTVTGSNGSVTLALGSNGNGNNPKWYDSGSAVRLYTGNTITITAKKDHVLTDIEFSVTSGSMLANGFSQTVTNDGNKFTLDKPANEIVYTTESKISIDKIKLSIAEPIAVTSAGLATYVSDDALDYTGKSISAYIAKEEGGKIKMTQVYKVPAGTGVLLKADGAAKVNIPITTEITTDDTDNVKDNLFKRGEGKTVESGSGSGLYNYILNNINNTVGFYRANKQTVARNRAYLQTSINASAEGRLSIFFDDEAGEATGISEVKDVKAADAIFNLNGVRVKNMTKGLYIVNGKKVIVK